MDFVTEAMLCKVFRLGDGKPMMPEISMMIPFERTREYQFSVSFDSTIRTSRANLRIGAPALTFHIFSYVIDTRTGRLLPHKLSEMILMIIFHAEP